MTIYTAARHRAAEPRPRVTATRTRPPGRGTAGRRRPVNTAAGIAASVWLVIVAVPLYYIALTSLRTSDSYLTDGALTPPSGLTLENYRQVVDLGFDTFIFNSTIVTVITMVLVLLMALPAAYAIVFGGTRAVRATFNTFLLGLAIPAQAVIIPIYLLITRLHLYDSLTAIILPTAAFSLPMAIVVLTSTLRDIPRELFDAMTVDGAGTVELFRRLVLPLSRPGLVSVGIFSGLNAWNGFIFPLVLTQSEARRVIPLGLWNFQSRFGTDVPGLLAAVVLSTVPVLALYLFGRRQLLRSLSAGYGR